MTDRELMQMALDALEAHADIGIKATKQIEALRARLAQQGEWQINEFGGSVWVAQPEPEPAAWRVWGRMGGISFRQSKPDASEYAEFDALYTVPPQREWQGLTDEEIIRATVFIDNRKSGWVLDLSRAIEAKLREKNT